MTALDSPPSITPPAIPYRARVHPGMSVAIATLVTGVALMFVSAGFLILAGYIFWRAAVLAGAMPGIKSDAIDSFMAFGIVPAVCGFLTFVFSVIVVISGLRRLARHAARVMG